MNKRIKTLIALIAFSLAAAGILHTLLKSTSRSEGITQNRQDTTQVNNLLQEGDYHFTKTNRTKHDLDSAFSAITKAYQISRKIDFRKGTGLSLNMYSKLHKAKGDTVQAREYADSAIVVFKSNNLFYELGFAYYHRSGFYPLDGVLMKRRIEWVKRAAEAFVQSGSRRKQADIYKELGDLQQADMSYVEAMKSLQQSLLLSDSSEYDRLLAIYDLLGDIHGVTGNYRLAIKYGLLALKTSEDLHDSTSASIATLHNRIGLTYARMGKSDIALRHYDKGEQISLLNQDSSNWIIIICNKVNLLRRTKGVREALQCLSKIPEHLLNDSRNITTRSTAHGLMLILNLALKKSDVCQIYEQHVITDYMHERQLGIQNITPPSILSIYYLKTHNLKKADLYWREGERICKESKSASNLATHYKIRIKIDSAKGDFKKYMEHVKELQVMNDRLLNEQNNREITQLQIEYEIEKKDKDILLKEERIKLLHAENRIQQANLLQATIIRNVTGGGIILLAVIVGLLYNRYRFKNKINQTITERNNVLNQLVTEKEWLLKEIHHRVKNNLQIIISLLDSQSMYLKDNAALNAIRDSQSRVYCMSLIHKKLYQSDNISTINMMRYIEELIDYLCSAFGVEQRITFELAIAEIQLSASQSIPIGLILNEAITNSIKYAFPEESGNTIGIHLSVVDNQCQLVIRDNGMGLPAGFNEENIKSLGISLMKGLSEDLDANFSIQNKNGTCIEISFILEQMVPSSIPDETLTLTAIS